MTTTKPAMKLIAVLVAIMAIGSGRALSESDGRSLRPSVVMIIRHAEEPSAGSNPNLSKLGYERAQALATVIPDHFARPDFLFATKKTSSSNRPVETITPLAQAMDEPIDSAFIDDDVTQLADAILADPKCAGKVVLICWHHEEIPALAKALGASDAPTKWNSKVYDRLWELTYDGSKVIFKNLPQKALPGDSQQ